MERHLRVVESGARAAPYPPDTKSRGWYFPLNVAQIRQSSAWALAARVPGLHNVLLRLWMESWEQIPMGSLPDDDEVIAALIEYPHGLFVEHRALIMHGWWKATDGRYYHDVIGKLVLGRLQHTEEEKTRKAEWRRRKAEEESRVTSRNASHAARQRRYREKHAPQLLDSPTEDVLSHGTTTDGHGKDDTGAGAGVKSLPLGSVESPSFALEGSAEGGGKALTRTERRNLHGTRLERDAPLPGEWQAWAIACYPLLTPQRVMRMWIEFRNHWSEVPGKAGLKLTWRGTWENNVHRAMRNG